MMDLMHTRIIAGCLMALVFDTFNKSWGPGGGFLALIFITTWALIVTLAERRSQKSSINNHTSTIER